MPFVIAQLVLFAFIGFQIAQVVKTSPNGNTDQSTTYPAP